jgi:hypothetical protein
MEAPANIAEQPHYEISSAELATWVERQGAEKWWSVDGDPYLVSRLSGFCRSDELATVLRRANRCLLVWDPQLRETATGQCITANELDGLLTRPSPAVFEALGQPVPKWATNRFFWVCWKGETNEWTLSEDPETTEAFRDVVTQPRTHQ